MSFLYTEDAVRAGTKTVTRRMGWQHLRPGTRIQAVRKCRGRKRGERIEPLHVIEVTSVTREPLRRLIDEQPYGWLEVEAEGFKGWKPSQFVQMFCGTHKGCTPETAVTRIAFKYVPA